MMLTHDQIATIRLVAEVLGGIGLWLADSPLVKKQKPGIVQEQPQGDQRIMNFAQISKLLTLIPVVVAGIEQIHSSASGETKQQLAQDALSLATGVYSYADSKNADKAQAVGSGVSSIIDSVVSIFNATGIFTHKTATVKAAIATAADPASPQTAVSAEVQSGPGLSNVVAA
jgi:formate-dependent phosphoribosylglycinamide formyltransferase (GAR transformylase)